MPETDERLAQLVSVLQIADLLGYSAEDRLAILACFADVTEGFPMELSNYPYVEIARHRVAALADAEDVPDGVIASRLLRSAQRRPPNDRFELAELVALRMLCREFGVR